MSETKHSPEPWACGPNPAGGPWVEVVDATGEEVAGADKCGAFYSEADARRIVACVNELAGISTEALEAGALARVLDQAAYTSETGGGLALLGIALRALGRLP